MMAALLGTDRAPKAVAADFDWTAWASNLLGSTVWAATCFLPTAGVGELGIFVGSMAGVLVSAGGALPKSAAEFGSFASENLMKLSEWFNAQMGTAGDAAYERALKEGWGDNRCRAEIYKGLLRPEFIGSASDGTPFVKQSDVAAACERDLLLYATRTPLKASSQTMQRSGASIDPALAMLVERDLSNVGRVCYHYTVDGMSRPEHGLLGFFGGREPTSPTRWSFRLEKVSMTMRGEIVQELDRTLKQIYGGGPVPVGELPVEKYLRLTEAGNVRSQAETPEVHVSKSNEVSNVHLEGEYEDYVARNGLRKSEYANQIVSTAWAKSGGHPPEAIIELWGS